MTRALAAVGRSLRIAAEGDVVATIITHLAIAKRYLENNPGFVDDVKSFYDGNILPDLAPDKEVSHYGNRQLVDGDIVARNVNKIGIKKFLKENPLDSDLNKGRLLHLYTDLEYYKTLIPNDYVKTLTWNEYRKDIIYTWWLDKQKSHDKYAGLFDKTSYAGELKDMYRRFHESDANEFQNNPATALYTEAELEQFIERIAKVDLFSIN